MSRIYICYRAFFLGNQTMAPNLPGFQGIKHCVQCLASHPHKPFFILLIIVMDQMKSDLHGVGIKKKATEPRIF